MKFTKAAASGQAITSNVTLYAKWQELYSVEYVNNGYGVQVDNLYNVDKLPTELPVLEEQGYEFNGWYYDKECTEQFIGAYNRVSSSPKTLTKEEVYALLEKDENGQNIIEDKLTLTLYAGWQANEYIVNYNVGASHSSPTYEILSEDTSIAGQTTYKVKAINQASDKYIFDDINPPKYYSFGYDYTGVWFAQNQGLAANNYNLNKTSSGNGTYLYSGDSGDKESLGDGHIISGSNIIASPENLNVNAYLQWQVQEFEIYLSNNTINDVSNFNCNF